MKGGTMNKLLEYLFYSKEYTYKEADKFEIGSDLSDQTYAKFLRDERVGAQLKDIGSILMHKSGCTFEEIADIGNYGDILYEMNEEKAYYLYSLITMGNEKVKAEMPRLQSGTVAKEHAKEFCKIVKMPHVEYRKWIKSSYEKSIPELTAEELFALPSLYVLRNLGKLKKQGSFEQYIELVKADPSYEYNFAGLYFAYLNRNDELGQLIFDRTNGVGYRGQVVIDFNIDEEKDLLRARKLLFSLFLARDNGNEIFNIQTGNKVKLSGNLKSDLDLLEAEVTYDTPNKKSDFTKLKEDSLIISSNIITKDDVEKCKPLTIFSVNNNQSTALHHYGNTKVISGFNAFLIKYAFKENDAEFMQQMIVHYANNTRKLKDILKDDY